MVWRIIMSFADVGALTSVGRPQKNWEKLGTDGWWSAPPLPPFFISTAESALVGIAALVPVGSGPVTSHKTPEPQLSCRAGDTYLHGRNVPGNSLPIRPVPTPRRSAPDRPLDHRTLQLPRHDLAGQLAKGEFVAVDRRAQQFAASQSQRPIPPPHERPQSQPAKCRHQSGGTLELSPPM